MLKGHTAGVQSVAFSADGKALITAGDDKTVKVVDVIASGSIALEAYVVQHVPIFAVLTGVEHAIPEVPLQPARAYQLGAQCANKP